MNTPEDPNHVPASTDCSPSQVLPSPTDEDDGPSCTRTRTGKVARLPKPTRDKINYMLLDGVPFGKIIETLGDEVKDLTERNISNWKAGGYLDWLAELQRKEALTATRDAAIDLLNQKAGQFHLQTGRGSS